MIFNTLIINNKQFVIFYKEALFIYIYIYTLFIHVIYTYRKLIYFFNLSSINIKSIRISLYIFLFFHISLEILHIISIQTLIFFKLMIF